MGSCVACKKKQGNREVFIKKKSVVQDSVVFIEENFKILDHTTYLRGIEDITEVKNRFSSYKAVDLRCVKGPRESKHDHSHLLAIFAKKIYSEALSEICLIVSYSPYGFALSIGDLDQILVDSNLTQANIELLYLPKTDNEKEVEISDIVEWSYEHKDEQYMDPFKIPEFNMGQRIYLHFVSILSRKAIEHRV